MLLEVRREGLAAIPKVVALDSVLGSLAVRSRRASHE